MQRIVSGVLSGTVLDLYQERPAFRIQSIERSRLAISMGIALKVKDHATNPGRLRDPGTDGLERRKGELGRSLWHNRRDKEASQREEDERSHGRK